MIAACVAALAAACAKKADEGAPAAEAGSPAVEAGSTAPEAEVALPTPAADAAPIGSANVSITLDANKNPAFSAVSEGFCIAGGACMGGIDTNAAGNIDLSWFPPGDVTVTVQLDDTAYGAGWRVPGDPWQAVAIVVVPPGSPTSPIPVFGQANWPQEFDAPSVSGQRSITFIDKEDDQNAYEYAIGLVNPAGTNVTIDPRIRNGSDGGNR